MSSEFSANDIDAVRQLIKLVTDNGLSELSITVREGISITVKSETAAPAYTPYRPPEQIPHAQAPAQLVHGAPSALPAPKASGKRGTPVASPATGIYYQSPSPGEPPFVKVGDIVQVGQVIGLLEAMKVFSDIHSDAAGRVLEVCAVDGQLVHDGDPLLFLQA